MPNLEINVAEFHISLTIMILSLTDVLFIIKVNDMKPILAEVTDAYDRK